METAPLHPKTNLMLLKEARLYLLKIHKLLIDTERAAWEKHHGSLTGGQFLNMLLNEQNLQWLRKFSTLVVEIDEMLDLDDGFSESMVEDHLSAIKRLINLNVEDADFTERYADSLQNNPSVALLHGELKKLFD